VLGLRSSRGLPGRGRKLANPSDGPVAQLGQDVHEVFPEVHVQAAAGLHDGGDGRHLRPGFRTADVQPILAAEGEKGSGVTSQRWTNGALGLTRGQCRGSNPLHGKTTAD